MPFPEPVNYSEIGRNAPVLPGDREGRLISINLRKSPSPSVGATFMVARRWGVLPIHLAHSKEQGHAPIPAGDHKGRTYGSYDLLPVFMAQVDAYWRYPCGLS